MSGPSGEPGPTDSPSGEPGTATAPSGGAPTRSWRADPALVALAVAPVAAAAALLAFLHVVGLTGVDTAAHVYKTSLVAHGQSLVWDDFWYGGSYGVVSYGVVYYLAARVVGAAAIVVLSAGLLPLLFHLYVRRAWQVTSLLPASVLAVVCVLYLTNGQDPFLLAMALTMAGLALLASDHPVWAAAPVGVAAFTNPVAVVVGAVFVVADAIARPATRRRTALFVAALLPFAVVWLGVLLAFRGHVSYLSQPAVLLRWTAVAAVGVVLARWSHDPDRRARQILFGVAAALCLAALVAPNELGNNASRFVVLFGLPTLLMVRRVRLPRVATAALLAAVAAVTLAAPVGDLLRTGDAAQTTRSFFAPALSYARLHYDPDYRYHVVALRLHWEADYFPQAGLPITRGWFRQSDWQHGAVLYQAPTPARYVAWLREMGVSDVFVPHATLDFSSVGEAALIARSGAFVRVADLAGWTVYRLRRPSPLVVAAGTVTAAAAPAPGAAVTSVAHSTVVIGVQRPGRYLVKFTWTPYWRLSAPRGAAGASLSAAPGDWTVLRAPRPGRYVLRVRPSLSNALTRIF
jgi:hypothetical protein